MKYPSVFDMIGPVMIGPSSSHTAGVAKIGRIARHLFETMMTKANSHHQVLRPLPKGNKVRC